MSRKFELEHPSANTQTITLSDEDATKLISWLTTTGENKNDRFVNFISDGKWHIVPIAIPDVIEAFDANPEDIRWSQG